MKIFSAACALSIALLTACDSAGDAGPTVPPTPGSIRIVSGAMQDSAGAQSSQPVVLEVRDNAGALPPAGTTVALTTRQRSDMTPVDEMLFRASPLQPFVGVLTLSVDQAGRVAFYTRHGTVIGPGRIAVSVPELNVLDTVRFVIVAASASEVELDPVVTTAKVGARFTISSHVTDRFDNPRTDSVAWTASGPGISVNHAGVVTATAVGSYEVTATSGSGQSVTKVSVVPAGRLAAGRSEAGREVIYMMDLDGTNVRALIQTSAIGSPLRPAFIPGTQSIVYSNSLVRGSAIRVLDPNGASTPFFSTLPPTSTAQLEPTPSADGRWLFFSAIDTRCGGLDYPCLFRSKIDGTGIEFLSAALPLGGLSEQPGPSPDGSKVAYVTTGPAGGQFKVLDVASRTNSSWGIHGKYPAWSPLGTSIAYVTNGGGPIMLVNPDGTGERALTPSGYKYKESTLGWSADGKWILASGPRYLELIDAQTGAAMTLYATPDMVNPSLR